MRQRISRDLTPVVGCILLIWVVEILNVLLGHGLTRFGILPRTTSGLLGIPLSPFIHASLTHAALNTAPLLVLGGLVGLRGRKVYLQATGVIVLLGGAAVWLLGRGAYHAGASGLIFGYFGFLVARGWYERSITALAVAGATAFLYGGILWGLMPTDDHVSWEGHLFGLLAGVLAARLK